MAKKAQEIHTKERKLSKKMKITQFMSNFFDSIQSSQRDDLTTAREIEMFETDVENMKQGVEDLNTRQYTGKSPWTRVTVQGNIQRTHPLKKEMTQYKNEIAALEKEFLDLCAADTNFHVHKNLYAQYAKELEEAGDMGNVSLYMRTDKAAFLPMISITMVSTIFRIASGTSVSSMYTTVLQI